MPASYKMLKFCAGGSLVSGVTFECHLLCDAVVVNCVEVVEFGCEWVAQGETNLMVKRGKENDEHTVEITATA